MKHLFKLLLIGLLPIVAFSQTIEEKQIITKDYNTNKLKELSISFKLDAELEKAKAIKLARQNNWPIRYEEDGKLMELMNISEEGKPIYFTTYNVDAAESTRANTMHNGGLLGLNVLGQNMEAHVWDGGLARSSHQEYDGAGGNNRFSIGDGTSTLHYHSAHVTGTIIASGYQANAKGMAPHANAIGYDWNSDLSEATSAANSGMLLSNHSYGWIANSIPDWYFGAYHSVSRSWDILLYNAPYYLMVVAAGNDGNDNSSNGNPLDGNSAYDKLSGMSTAKNNLVVANGQDANIDANGNLISVYINSSSSEGPTDDYRIKPDITGNGTSLYSTFEGYNSEYGNLTGTSMAAPNITGTLVLLQQHYNNINGNFMKAATLKGLALHTADDAGPSGPDAKYGWGLLNAKDAANAITNDGVESSISELALSSLNSSYTINVNSDGINDLVASISWTDPAGSANYGTPNDPDPVLVNDLDIRVTKSSNTYYPYRLTSITTNGTGDNVVDPFEKIIVSGATGNYTITVTHKGSLSGGSQNFSLIVTGISNSTLPPIANFNADDTSPVIGQTVSFTDLSTNSPTAWQWSFSGPGNAVFVNGTNANSTNPEIQFDALGFYTAVLYVSNDFGNDTETKTNYIEVVEPGALENPTDLTAQIVNENDVLLNWSAPSGGGSGEEFFEGFESGTLPTSWLAIDNDGDGHNWENTIENGFGFDAFEGNGAMTSASYVNDVGALTPDNYLITPVIEIGPASTLSYWHDAQDADWPDDFYYVKLSTTGTNLSDFTETLWSGTTPTDWAEVTIDLSAYAGNNCHIAFQHTNCTDWFYMKIDNFSISNTKTQSLFTPSAIAGTNEGMPFRTSGMSQNEITKAYENYMSQIVSTKALIGYNVYRDGLMIDYTTVTTYTDTDLENGTYDYCVTAVYDEGESPCSNSVSVTINVVVILDPPTNLTAQVVNENDVLLNWNAPSGGGGEGEWIQWDSGENEGNGIGLTSGGTFYVASHWTASDLTGYIGKSVSQLSFFPYGDPNATFTLKIWTGPNANTVIMSQTVGSFTVDEFNIIDLNNPVTINSSTEYWFGYTVTHAEGTNPAGIDPGPAIQGKGDMISFDGNSWVSMSAEYNLDYNWNIAVYVDDSKNAVQPQPLSKSTFPVSDGNFTDSGSTGIIKYFNPIQTKELTGYNLYRDDVFVDYTTETTYTDTDLENGTYDYCVTAVYDEGESPCSNTVSVTIFVCIPDPPTNLTASIIDFDNVQMNWDAPSCEDIQGYNIYRNNVNIDFVTTTSYYDSNLEDGSYDYCVTAVYDEGETNCSNTATILIESCIPDPPTNLTASIIDYVNVQLNWDAPDCEDLSGYNIYRNSINIDFVTTTSYYDSNLEDGPYEYCVTAVYDEGETDCSNTASVTIVGCFPDPPSNLNATIVDDINVQLDWDAPECEDIQGYNVYRNDENLDFVTTASYLDGNLENGTYDYCITAVYDEGETDCSNTASATILVLDPPNNLTGTLDYNDLTLCWDAPAEKNILGLENEGNTKSLLGYNIYRDGNLLGYTTEDCLTEECLPPGSSYTYCVTAVYDEGESDCSNEFTVDITLEAPQNLAYTLNENNVVLEWDAVKGFEGYNVYHSFNSGNFELLNDEPLSGNTYEYSDAAIGYHEFYVKALYCEWESDPSNTVQFTIVGIEENLSDNIRVYPNPVSDFVNINSETVISNIKVFSNLGQLVLDVDVLENDYKVNMSGFENGVYLIKIETKKGITIKRIIKR